MGALTFCGSPRTDVRVESANVRVEGAEGRVESADMRVEGAEARVESADVRVEGADVGGGGVGRRAVGVTSCDAVDLKVREPRRRRAAATREDAAGVRIEGV